MKSFKQYLREIEIIPTDTYPDGSPVPPGWEYDPVKDQSVPIDVTPTYEPEAPINPIGKWLRELYKKWKDFLPWYAPQPPRPPTCSVADCPEQWEQYMSDWFEYINDNIHDFFERWSEQNPDGTWAEFLCDIGLCNMGNPNNWPSGPPPYWDEDLHGPWPPFQPPW